MIIIMMSDIVVTERIADLNNDEIHTKDDSLQVELHEKAKKEKEITQEKAKNTHINKALLKEKEISQQQN